MRNWMKSVVVAAVGLVAVPVMGLSMAPSKSSAKTVAKPAGKVTHVDAKSAAKKSTTAAKPVARTVTKNTSPRPASVRLGKNTAAKASKKQGQTKTAALATPVKTKTNAKTKPVMVTRTPVRPTTLHSAPAKLPGPRSTLSKAIEKTRTPSSPTRSAAKSKSEMN